MVLSGSIPGLPAEQKGKVKMPIYKDVAGAEREYHLEAYAHVSSSAIKSTTGIAGSEEQELLQQQRVGTGRAAALDADGGIDVYRL